MPVCISRRCSEAPSQQDECSTLTRRQGTAQGDRSLPSRFQAQHGSPGHRDSEPSLGIRFSVFWRRFLYTSSFVNMTSDHVCRW